MASTPSPPPTSTHGQGHGEVFHRLVRTLSGRSIRDDGAANAGSSSSTPAEQQPTTSNTETTNTYADDANEDDNNIRISVSERLKKISNNALVKLRRGSNNKTSAASPRVTAVSPLPDDSGYGSSSSSSSSPPTPILSPAARDGHAKMLSMVAELVEAESSASSYASSMNSPDPTTPPAVSSPTTPSTPATPTPSTPTPSPNTLARRLQSLIDALPFPLPDPSSSDPSSSSPSSSDPSSPSSPSHQHPHHHIPIHPQPPKRDKSGKPIPPPLSTPIKDPDGRLVGLLSSATFMNGGGRAKERAGGAGGGAGGGGRPSVWSILEALGAPPHGFPPEDEVPGGDADGEGPGENTPSGEDGGHGNGDEDNDTDIYSDNSSIMVYSPLIPSGSDIVELAELVPVEVDEYEYEYEQDVDEQQVGAEMVVPATSWTAVWPLSILYAAAAAGSASSSSSTNAEKRHPSIHQRLSSDLVLGPTITTTTTDAAGRRVRTQVVRAWVPSASKLSVQAMWWGYRMYLPPPVMAILSDKTIEATKRAAMLTTALTWFFNHLPVDALPPALRPAALLLQRLAPYLGYIGTFIAWSWSTVKGYDIGFGVTLTATWLLPIALIPGTWYENAFPKSPSQAPPAQLPPATPGTPSTTLPSTPSAPSTTVPSTPSTPTPTSPSPSVPPSSSTPTSPSPPAAPTLPLPDGSTTVPAPTPASPGNAQKRPPRTGGMGMPTSPKALAKMLFSSSSPSPSPSPSSASSTSPSARTPSSGYASAAAASPSSASSSAYASALSTPIPIPIAPDPLEPLPVPPVPIASPKLEPVQVGSPLMHELLHGPVLGTVDLPDDEEEGQADEADIPTAASATLPPTPGPVSTPVAEEKRKGKRGLFGRR